MHRVVAVPLGIALCLAAGVGPAAQQPPVAPIDAAVDELVWWLPPDTETIQVTQTPKRPPSGPLFDGMEFLRGEIGPADLSYAGTLAKHLRTARIKATVDGARRFRRPSGLGSTLYEGAIIILFERPIPARTELIATLITQSFATQEIRGISVVEFRDKREDDIWTSLIASPRPDVLIVATDRRYLEALLRRRGRQERSRALPNDLPEWRWVDTSAPFWAVRHFRRDGAAQDPTSPFAKHRAGVFDPDAVGVATYATADGRTILAHYISRAKNAEHIARLIWQHPGDGLTPILRRVGDDAVQVQFDARDEVHLSTFLFSLMALLGHATYV